jgi:hypothetical protein
MPSRLRSWTLLPKILPLTQASLASIPSPPLDPGPPSWTLLKLTSKVSVPEIEMHSWLPSLHASSTLLPLTVTLLHRSTKYRQIFHGGNIRLSLLHASSTRGS